VGRIRHLFFESARRRGARGGRGRIRGGDDPVILARSSIPTGRGIFLGAWAGVVIWWNRIPASNDREWMTETAVLPSATVAGDQVTLHNLRNFDYRTETDFTPRSDDKTFDLTQLDSVDLICVSWGGTAIGHVMVSFGFAGQDYVCFSIERRV
jgi:hypothetical protein